MKINQKLNPNPPNVIDNYFPTKNDEVKTQNQLSDKTTNHLRHI